MTWSGRAWVITLLAAVTLAGCASDVPGSPVTAGPQVTSGSSAYPERPREESIAGVDPCNLLTLQQQQSLGVDRSPRSSADPMFDGAPVCLFGSTEQEFTIVVTAVTSQGLDEYVATGQGQIPTSRTQVVDFPATEIRPGADAAGNLFCFVGVDTAARQFLLVNVGQIAPLGPPMPLDALCERARQAAEAAMTTLLGLR